MKLRIVAECPRTGKVETLAKPRSLKGAAQRLIVDGNFWYGLGWSGIGLEVDTGDGWRLLQRREVPADLPPGIRAELRWQSV